MEKMHIGYDAKRLYSNSSGLGNYSRTLVRNMMTLFPDNEYSLFTTKKNPDLETSYFDHQANVIHYNGVLSGAWRTIRIAQKTNEMGLHLFHGLSNEIPLGLDIPAIVTIHDVIFKHLPTTYKPWDRWIYNQKTTIACNEADKIIAISQQTKRDLLQYYQIPEDKIEVVYQSVDPIFYVMESETTNIQHLQLPDKFMLTVGNLEERKNQLLILEAMGQIPKSERIPLVIVGKGKGYHQRMLEYIEQHQLHEWVHFVQDYLSTAELKSVYEAANMMIYPSSFEGFGLPVVEALLSRTPVITNRAASLPEAGGPDTCYLDVLEASHLAEAILKLTKDKKLCDHMAEKGYQYAMNEFHPNLLTRQLLKVYKDTIRLHE